MATLIQVSKNFCTVEETMNRYYPSRDWRKIICAMEEETICVPPCTDVLPFAHRGPFNKAPEKARGQSGENKFLQQFIQLRLGGILIGGLDSKDLRNAGKNAGAPVELDDGECDFIFIHERFGIFIVEVKATAALGYILKKNVERQLDRNFINITRHFQYLFQRKLATVTGIACYPSLGVESWRVYKYASDVNRHFGYYRTTVNESFTDIKKIFMSTQIAEIHDKPYIVSFAAELVCCRTKVVLHSQSFNAIQIAQWIQTQDFESDKQKLRKQQLGEQQQNEIDSATFGTIYLTREQMKIFYCQSNNVTVRGAPGSGKTLIVKLRALAAAKLKKEGSKIFIFVNDALMAKYEAFFNKEQCRGTNFIKRKPIICTVDYLRRIKSEDDVFFDEAPIEETLMKKISKRASASGQTFVVITGFDKPQHASTDFEFFKRSLEKFDNFELNVVIRGTKNVFNEWKIHFCRGRMIPKFGHSIDGVPINREHFENFGRVQHYLLKKITALLVDANESSNNDSASNLPKLRYEHIGIITSHSEDAEIIRRFLSNNNICSGSVEEQIADTAGSVLAVDTYYRTVSYEWPVVFIVYRRGDEAVTKESVISIAAPRCIAKLFIIEYDKVTAAHDQFVKEYEDSSSVTTENYDPSDSDQPFTSSPECYTEDSDAGEWHTEEEQRWILVTLNIRKNSYIEKNLQKFVRDFVLMAQLNGLKLTKLPMKYYTEIPVQEILYSAADLIIVIDGIRDHYNPKSFKKACTSMNALTNGISEKCSVLTVDEYGLEEYVFYKNLPKHRPMFNRFVSTQVAADCIAASNPRRANEPMTSLTRTICDLYRAFRAQRQQSISSPRRFQKSPKQQWIQVTVYNPFTEETDRISALFFERLIKVANAHTKFNLNVTPVGIIEELSWKRAFETLHKLLDTRQVYADYIFAVDDYPRSNATDRGHTRLLEEFPSGPICFRESKETASNFALNHNRYQIFARNNVIKLVCRAF